MSIITISRGSYSKGKEIAEKTAQRLGYECVSREVILEASEQFNIPEIKLIRAIHDAPTILDRLTIERSTFVAYIRVALLQHLTLDNVVYHGLAGHFLVSAVPHALKLRIIADWDDRVRLEMARNDLPHDEAERILRDDDEQRRRWSLHLHSLDPSDASSYDLVLHIHRMTADDAVDIICHAVELERYQSTPKSKQIISDLLLAAKVQVATMDLVANAEITANSGVVHIRPERGSSISEAKLRQFEKRARDIPGVEGVEEHVHRPNPESSYSNPWFKI